MKEICIMAEIVKIWLRIEISSWLTFGITCTYDLIFRQVLQFNRLSNGSRKIQTTNGDGGGWYTDQNREKRVRYNEMIGICSKR